MSLPAAWIGYGVSRSAGTVAGYLVGVGLLSLAVPIMRTCLIVTDEGLIDHRAVRTVRIGWQQIAEFRVERPGGLWDGFCVVAARRDGAQTDLLSTRVYTRAPSERHIDELHRICWALDELLATHGENLPSDP
jgi:hypothetical protein